MLEPIILTAFILLQGADAFMTRWVLSHGGSEANPFLRWLFAEVGVDEGLIMMKALAIVLLVSAYAVAGPVYALVFVALYVGLFFWNLRTIMRVRTRLGKQ